MSTNLYWEPKSRKKNKAGKDATLKWALEKRYGYPVSLTMDYQSVAYLQGLADGGVDGAAELIAAIEKYEQIEVFSE